MTTLEVREQIAFSQIMLEGPETQERFWKMIEKGETAQAALMFATQRAPGVKGGDRVFNENARRRMAEIPAEQLSKILEIAKGAGINTQGKYYVGGLGRYNDPAAWVSTSDDILAVARKRGYVVSGVVNHDPGETKQLEQQIKNQPILAPDIVNDLARKRIAEDPKLQEQLRKSPKKTMDKVKDDVIHKHGRRRKT